MKQFTLFIIVIFFTIPAIGQKGYYYTDNSIISGIELLKKGKSNTYFCFVKDKDGIIKYTPFEVSEYAFNEGYVYKSFDIIINEHKERYFLKQIVKGNLCLYYLNLKGGIKKYYISLGNDLNLIELQFKKAVVQEIIGNYTDYCPQATQNLRYLRAKKHSLKRYLNDLNSCSNHPFPKLQYGFKIGIASTQFFPVDKSSTYGIPDYNSDYSYTIGAFIDIPIQSSNLSFSPEIYYKENHYSRSNSNPVESFDLIMNYSSINIPVLFKYKFIRNGIIPYIQTGPIYSQLIKDKVVLYEYKKSGSDIFIEKNEEPIIQKNMTGISFGGGLIPASRKRVNWFGEVRYNYLININSTQKHFNIGEISINTGILF